MENFAKLGLDMDVLVGKLPAGDVCDPLDIIPVLSDISPPTIEGLQLLASQLSLEI